MSNNNYISFDAHVWKIVFDKTAGNFCIETHDRETQEIAFHVVDTDRFRVIWEGNPVTSIDIVSLLAVVDNHLILAMYSDPEEPKISQLICYDVNYEKIVWELSDTEFVGIRSGVIVSEKGKERTLDISTGKETSGSGILENYHLRTPERYLEESEYFETVRSFIASKLNESPVRVIDYLETSHSILISYYLYDERNYHQYLTIFGKNGSLKKKITLEKDLQGIGTESFVIQGDYFYFVRGRSDFIRERL